MNYKPHRNEGSLDKAVSDLPHRSGHLSEYLFCRFREPLDFPFFSPQNFDTP